MERKKFVRTVIIIISICSIVRILSVYIDAKRKQQERMEALHQQELKHITLVTSGKVKFGDDISPEFDSGYVIMKVVLYNECIDRGVEKGEKISSYMEVQEEFDDYISGRKTLEECRAINALSDFNKAECYRAYENPKQGIRYSYNDYILSVGEELKRNKENKYYSFTEFSNEEMEAASKIAAKKWCDYMEGK